MQAQFDLAASAPEGTPSFPRPGQQPPYAGANTHQQYPGYLTQGQQPQGPTGGGPGGGPGGGSHDQRPPPPFEGDGGQVFGREKGGFIGEYRPQVLVEILRAPDAFTTDSSRRASSDGRAALVEPE